MAPTRSIARAEREQKLESILSFASSLTSRLNTSRDATLAADLQEHIKALPLQASPAVIAKQDVLDRRGTELWNLSTRLRRNELQQGDEGASLQNQTLCLLRVLSFLLLDTAGAHSTKARERKTCFRLLKIALKAAKVCIESTEFSGATKVLERAADYQEVLSTDTDGKDDEETQIANRLLVEYYTVRTALAWRQNRTDIAEHMFAQYTHRKIALTPSTAENLGDLLYEIGKGLLSKRNYELAVRWLERAHDALGEQELEMLSAEAGELRLSVMQSIVQAYIKLDDPEARNKAWNMVKHMEVDYEDKMVILLLKLELLSSGETRDVDQSYAVLHKMIRSVVLNDRNLKTIMHHIHKQKDHSVTACKLIDELITVRLFGEDKESWIEKCVITRIWMCCSNVVPDDILEQLHELFDAISHNSKAPFSAHATHAAQTLLWKQVEARFSQEQFVMAEKWCRVCLHSLFEKAGDANKSKVARKMILCALARHDYATARTVFTTMSETGRNDRITRYLMYKAGLQNGEPDFVAECLDIVCRQSSKDTSLLQACVLEAQSSGNKRQAIAALEKVLDKYNHSEPGDVHIPALLRMTARLLISELVKDGSLDSEVSGQMCIIFEGACIQAKASRRRPTTTAREQFSIGELQWFSKNAYNMSIKYCAEMQPGYLVRLLDVCIEFVKLLREDNQINDQADLSLRSMFCHFLAVCALTTLARAEDNVQDCLQYYLQARKHGKSFRADAADSMDKLGDSAQHDVITKHFQIVKLELEAALKLEQWDELDELFDQCWAYKNPGPYETLADLVLVIHNCIVKANLDGRYQGKILSVLQKIVNMTWRQTDNDIIKLSRWIRCLYQLALTYDENISLKCMDQAIQIAATRQGESNCYPSTELEWLATTSFNHAVDYYVQENDKKCKAWAEKALTLAQWAEDEGELKSMLMEKYSGLTWADEEGQTG